MHDAGDASEPRTDSVAIRLLGPGDAHVLDRVALDVFDEALVPELVHEFFADPRHHIAVAIESDTVIGVVSSFHYVHPDKKPQMWINEVMVAPDRRRRGIASRLIRRMVDHAHDLGCTDVWLLTERDNIPARSLYESLEGEEFAGGVVGFSFKLGAPKGPPAW